MLPSFRGKTVLSASLGAQAPTGAGTPRELFFDAHGVIAQPADKYDLVVCASAGATFLDQATLTAITACLRPGGEMLLQEVVRIAELPAAVHRAAQVRGLREASGLRRALLFAGLATTGGAPATAPTPLAREAWVTAVAALHPQLASLASAGSLEAVDALDALAAALGPSLGVCTITCTRPEFKAGASFSLRSRTAVANPAAPVPTPAPTPAAQLGAWGTAVASARAEVGDELIDEDELLSAEDLAKKEAVMDCGTGSDGKRKACKNCSCGLREMLEDDAADENAPPPAKSACGNCALGDAYRCAGCPHRGKPSFVEGSDGLKLADAMMQGDSEAALPAPSVLTASSGGGSGGVVKLSLDDTMDL